MPLKIKAGDALPDTPFGQLSKGKVVVVGICNNGLDAEQHLPGLADSLDDIKSKGIDEIFVTGVTDVVSLNGALKNASLNGKVTPLADGGIFAKAVGTYSEDDGKPGAHRLAMIIDNGKIMWVKEDKKSEFGETSAFAIIEGLNHVYKLA